MRKKFYIAVVELNCGLRRYFNTIVVLGKRQCTLSSDRKECMHYSEKEIEELEQIIKAEAKRMKIVSCEVVSKQAAKKIFN